MNEKKRRDITLGEMQDECIRVSGDCSKCSFLHPCDSLNPRALPMDIDLTDPPRFTEAQMKILKALYDNGIRRIISDEDEFILTDTENTAIAIWDLLKLRCPEIVDLAKLLQ